MTEIITTKYTFYDLATGEILSSGISYDPQSFMQAGVGMIEEQVHDLRGHYIDLADLTVKAKGTCPTKYHEFDYTAKAYVVKDSGLQRAKEDKIALVDMLREQKSADPIELNGVLFDGDLKARSNVSAWLNVINSGASVPAGFVWRDYTNNDHPADAQFVRELATALAMRGTALYAASWAHKAAVGALQSVADVLAYNVQANW